jgi:histidinol-phosphate/aromatic aminotransferase/cobyric acid decarboxylase-like protein
LTKEERALAALERRRKDVEMQRQKITEEREKIDQFLNQAKEVGRGMFRKKEYYIFLVHAITHC